MYAEPWLKFIIISLQETIELRTNLGIIKEVFFLSYGIVKMFWKLVENRFNSD